MGRYDDIITLEHPVSKVHPRMSVMDRAAQFSAFAALSGYEDAIDETERLTETYTELDEGEKEILNEQLLKIKENIASHPAATCTYFEPDPKRRAARTAHTAAKCARSMSMRKSWCLKTEPRSGSILCGISRSVLLYCNDTNLKIISCRNGGR